MLVAQGRRQAVDLGFRGHDQRDVLVEPQEPPDPVTEIAHIVIIEGIAERQHGHRMGDLVELFSRGCTDMQARAVGPHQVREPALDRRIAQAKGVILRVRYRRRVFLIIALVVFSDFSASRASSSAACSAVSSSTLALSLLMPPP